MLNHVTLHGRLVRDPELRATPAGKSVVTISLACERDFAPEGRDKETDFIDAVFWGKTAEFIVRNFTKGQMALIDGRIQVRKWQDKEGNNRYTTEILGNNIYFAGKKETGSESAYTRPTYEEVTEQDDDIPF